MISKEELKEYASTRNLNIGQAEIDFFQNLILSIIYRKHGKELVFKGGTALTKCYGLTRFSEDLDFTANVEINAMDEIRKELKKYSIEFEIKESRILIQGPLYTGIRQSLCSIRIEISTREKVMMEPKIVTIRTMTPQLPSFDVITMQLEEIFAEKIRAITMREQARDLYDIYMIKEHIPPKKLIEKKLSIYNKEYEPEKIREKIKDFRSTWEEELGVLMTKIPDFDEVKDTIEKTLAAIK